MVTGGDEPVPTRHIEVERKFDVGDTTATPSFGELDIVARVERQPVHDLHAVYFDTPDRQLTTSRIALRRRTGGSDAGWHLKFPASETARTEIRAELGEGPDTDVPASLRRMIAELIGDHPLEAIARIANHRTVDVLYGADGSVLAEFCDDHVSATAEGDGVEERWREWEIELSEDAAANDDTGEQLMERLSAFLEQAGARPAVHASKLARTLHSPR